MQTDVMWWQLRTADLTTPCTILNLKTFPKRNEHLLCPVMSAEHFFRHHRIPCCLLYSCLKKMHGFDTHTKQFRN